MAPKIDAMPDDPPVPHPSAIEIAEQQRRYAQSLLELASQYPGRERCFPQGEPVCEACTDPLESSA
jgi:hypothetical protein